MAEDQLIAVATSDGKNIDREFGKAHAFDIYRIAAGDTPTAVFLEHRVLSLGDSVDVPAPADAPCSPEKGCAGGGCGGGGNGCAGAASPQLKQRIEAVSDCVCVLCTHAGPGAQKLLSANAVTLFDVMLPIERALPKVVAWYTRSSRIKR